VFSVVVGLLLHVWVCAFRDALIVVVVLTKLRL